MAVIKSVSSTLQELAPAPRGIYQVGTSSKTLRFGSDNLWPQAVQNLHRNSIPLRAVINSRVEYTLANGIIGEGPFMDWKEELDFEEISKRLLGDYSRGGNAWMEIVTTPTRQGLKVFHHDWLTVRKDATRTKAQISYGWENSPSIEDKKVREIPLYPEWSEPQDGLIRTMYHWKRYESGFRDYGVPFYLPALNAGAIGYKTTRWNLSRLDNSMRSSGILIVKSGFKDQAEATEFADSVVDEHTGEGQNHKFQVLTLDTSGGTEYIELGRTDDGDWTSLHRQSAGDIITACQWFRSLSAMEDSTGFNTERIINEYQLALRSVVKPSQKDFINMLKMSIGEVMGWDLSLISFENQSPIDDPDPFKTVNEIREESGLAPIENGNILWANVINNTKGSIEKGSS
jgi:hypothetical protein